MKEMILKVCCGITAAFAVGVAHAYNSDTLGFYAFMDAEAGASAFSGSAVATNSVSDSTISAATITRGKDAYDATFQAVRPGRYVYESSHPGAAVIAINPQSLHIESGKSGEGNKGSRLTFSDAGATLSQHHDTGFTVEFFMLANPGERWYRYNHQMYLSCGYRDLADDTFKSMAYFLPYAANSYYVGYSSAEQNLYKSQMYYDGMEGSFTNGVWHHVALVERIVGSATHFETYIDGVKGTDYTIDTSNVSIETMSSGGAFQIGYGNLTAAISCVRFTKRALTADDFMWASDSPPQSAGEGAFAFYSFAGSTVGESAVGTTLVNSVMPGTCDGSVTLDGTASSPFAVFDDDAPGRYVYSKKYGTLICERPKSIHVWSTSTDGKGGTLTLGSIGTELSRHHASGHTIEYFCKLDGTKCNAWAQSLNVNGGYKKPKATTTSPLRLYFPKSGSAVNEGICCLDYYEDDPTKNPCRTDFMVSAAPNDGNWHHVALVETTDLKIEFYYDYVLQGSFDLGSVGQLTGNSDFVFFRSKLQGKVACLRFSDRQLDADGFLRAYPREAEVIQKDVAAFYTFKDGDSGSSAKGVSLLNDANLFLAQGVASVNSDAAAKVCFDSDCPGMAIYGGEEYPQVPFVTNPMSIAVNNDEKAGKSGTIRFQGLSKTLYDAHKTGFTIEYFFEFIDGKIEQWDPSYKINAGYLNGADKATFNISLPLTTAGTQYLYGFGFDQSQGQKSASLPGVLWDGKWHHLAYVETPVVDTTSDPVVTNWAVNVWIDYKNHGESYIVSNIVASASAIDLNAPGLELCCQKQHCKYSCVKVTTRPLGKREFMRTRPRNMGMSILVR